MHQSCIPVMDMSMMTALELMMLFHSALSVYMAIFTQGLTFTFCYNHRPLEHMHISVQMILHRQVVWDSELEYPLSIECTVPTRAWEIFSVIHDNGG